MKHLLIGVRSLACRWLVVLLMTTTAASAAADPPASAARFERTEVHMGVDFRIVLYSPAEPTANEAFAAAFARIAALNAVCSDYDPDSELMRLCRSSGPGKPVKVSPDLLNVLTRAADMSRASRGAFDATVGPYVRLWRRARRQRELPDPDRLQEARQLVGYELVRIDREQQTVELLQDGMRLDLGGIAKGYAVDEAMQELRRRGIRAALVDGSGDILAGDPPPGEAGWKIGLAALRTPDAAPSEFLTIANQAVATSGDAYQFIEVEGVRYSHIVDPRTGLGVTRRSSVTVVAANCTEADAWASALSVLGPERGFPLIDPLDGISAFVVTLDGDRPQAHRACGFPETHPANQR